MFVYFTRSTDNGVKSAKLLALLNQRYRVDRWYVHYMVLLQEFLQIYMIYMCTSRKPANFILTTGTLALHISWRTSIPGADSKVDRTALRFSAKISSAYSTDLPGIMHVKSKSESWREGMGSTRSVKTWGKWKENDCLTLMILIQYLQTCFCEIHMWTITDFFRGSGFHSPCLGAEAIGAAAKGLHDPAVIQFLKRWAEKFDARALDVVLALSWMLPAELLQTWNCKTTLGSTTSKEGDLSVWWTRS